MQITLTPVRRDDSLTVLRAGDTLVLNGLALDLAAYDAEAAPCDWIVGQPLRLAGTWQVTLILPHGPVDDPGQPGAQAVLFPAPLSLAGDGPVVLPALPAPD